MSSRGSSSGIELAESAVATFERTTSKTPAPSLGALVNDRFELVRRIGSGGMGVVYEAIDRERDARVALKTLGRWSAEALLLFKNEFRALQHLSHPNLVRLGELLEDGGRWFFTMELLHGDDVLRYVRPQPRDAADTPSTITGRTTSASWSTGRTPPTMPAVPGGAVHRSAGSGQRRRGGRLDLARLRPCLRQLVEGIAALHAQRKVHRDIKPSNVLVEPSGRLVILDFGLITEVGAAGSSIMGTVPYMAPEQARGETIDGAADWYAVGVLLFEALTGSLPFCGQRWQIIEGKVSGDAPRAQSLAPEIPDDLDALCADLLRRDPRERPDDQTLLRRLGVEPAPTIVSGSSDRFVGRVAELGVMARGLEAARAGGAAVVVRGQSGVGKSALVDEFLARLDRPDVIVLTGRCYERESVPYKAFDQVMDALSQTLVNLPDELGASLVPAHAQLLASVFPVLHGWRALRRASRDDDAKPLDPKEQRLRLFAGVRELLTRLGLVRQVVVAIDDLQWADADSLVMLRAILTAADRPRLLLVATIRDGADDAVGALFEEVEHSAPGTVREIELGPLPPADANELARELWRESFGAGDPDDEATIAREASGHPLFIAALIRHLRATGASGASLRLDEMIASQMRRLVPPARRVLDLLAAAGKPLRLDVLALAAGMSLDDLHRCVNQLYDARMVGALGIHRGDRVGLYHDRIRETAVATMAGPERRERALRLARSFELVGDSDPETLAVSWLEAGRPRRALRYRVAAADEAARVFAFDRAARLYRLALEQLPDEHDQRLELLEKLGDALVNAGRGAEAAEAYLRAASRAERLAAIEHRRRAAEQLLLSGHIDRGVEMLQDVLADVGMHMPRSPRRCLASLLVRRAKLALRGSRPKSGDAPALSPLSRLRMEVCRSASMGLGMVDNIRAADFQTQGFLLALRSGDRPRIAVGMALEACFLATGGQPKAARVRRLVEASADLAERTGDPHALGMAAVAGGTAAVLQARWADGLQALDRAQRIFRQRCVGVSWEIETARLMGLWCLWHLGDLGPLRARLLEYRRDAELRGDRYAVANYRCSFPMNAWLVAHQPERAARDVAAEVEAWSHRGFHLQHYYHLYAQVQLALYHGDGDRALAVLDASWRALRRSMMLRIELARATILDCRGRAALAAAAARPPDQRRALLRVALRDARALERLGSPASVPCGQLVRAAASALTGARDRAAASLERAEAGFRSAGMRLHENVARLRRAALGSDSPAPALGVFAEMGVARPERLVALIAPGFDPENPLALGE